MELDGKRAITREDVKQKIQQTERSGKIEEEFTLLMRKGYKLPGFSEPSIRLPLPVDPEIVWSFETGRFKRVVDSWASSTDKSDSMIKARHHSCPKRLRSPEHTDIHRKQEISLKQLHGWTFWRILRSTETGKPRRLCGHSSYNASARYLNPRHPNNKPTCRPILHGIRESFLGCTIQ